MTEKTNKASHITRGDVFDDLGFSPAEASALKIKARILSALLKRIREKRYTQMQLARILNDYQPNISNLVNGKISKMSIEKLLSYAQRMNLETEIKITPRSRSVRSRKSRVA